TCNLLLPPFSLTPSQTQSHSVNMKLVVFACLVAVAVAAPQIRGDAPEYAEIIAYENEDSGDGNFRYSFQTSNGINQNARGYPGSQGQSNIEGSFR
ncbi:Cuticle protein, partial [Homarus americanus]